MIHKLMISYKGTFHLPPKVLYLQLFEKFTIMIQKERGVCSMEKQKQVYRYYRYDGEKLLAKREIPYEIKLSSRLILDELCYQWNKATLESQINEAIEQGDRETFRQLSHEYKYFTLE